MSIDSEMTRIENNVDDALAAVSEYGVEVTAGANSDQLSGLIRAIPKANYKKFTVTIPTAAANQDVKVVFGDPDVAEHYADETAVCTVRKVSNNDTNGIVMIIGANHSFAGRYGVYVAYNASSNSASALTYNHPLYDDAYTDGQAKVGCNSNGDIIVRAYRLASNFGGADYIIEFSW